MKLNLQNLQNRAARVITGDNYDVRSKQILRNLGWKTLDERRQNLTGKCMSNVMNDNYPEIIGNLFKNSNNCKYNLRTNGKFLRQALNDAFVSNLIQTNLIHQLNSTQMRRITLLNSTGRIKFVSLALSVWLRRIMRQKCVSKLNDE